MSTTKSFHNASLLWLLWLLRILRLLDPFEVRVVPSSYNSSTRVQLLGLARPACIVVLAATFVLREVSEQSGGGGGRLKSSS